MRNFNANYCAKNQRKTAFPLIFEGGIRGQAPKSFEAARDTLVPDQCSLAERPRMES